jgi:predicted outer membrane repeat protein
MTKFDAWRETLVAAALCLANTAVAQVPCFTDARHIVLEARVEWNYTTGGGCFGGCLGPDYYSYSTTLHREVDDCLLPAGCLDQVLQLSGNDRMGQVLFGPCCQPPSVTYTGTFDLRVSLDLRVATRIRVTQLGGGRVTIEASGVPKNFEYTAEWWPGDAEGESELTPGICTLRISGSCDSGIQMAGARLPTSVQVHASELPVLVPTVYPTIQDAVDAVGPGRVIPVAEGVHPGPVDFRGKSLSVCASGDRASTIIDGTGLSTSVVRAVTGETSATVLQGFTIRNGTAGTLVNGHRVGGGVLVQNASPTIRDCAFVSNAADAGGGLAAISSHLVIDGCTFSSNTAGTGGGLWLDNGLAYVTNCVISDNTATGHGGGLYATPLPGQLPNALLSGNTVCGNASGDAGRTNVWALVDDGGNTICDCFGDVDGNGVTDTADISLTLLFFGSATDPDFIQPDQDMNGFVDTADIALLLLNFGQCP